MPHRRGRARPWPTRRPPRAATAVCGWVLVASGLVLITDTAHAGTPTIANYTDATTVTEQTAGTLDADVTLGGSNSYGGGYLEFSVGSAGTADVLGVTKVDTPVTTDGVVSVAGSSVYLGNGTIAEPIGSIDSTFNGGSGQKLRISFVSEFSNSSFEEGITGWTYMDQQIILGETEIAGRVTTDDAYYPGTCGVRDDDTVTNIGSGAFNYEIIGSGTAPYPTNGSKALRLLSSISSVDGHIIHGPAIYSGVFPASSGDVIYFDWAAENGGDDYHVYGYLLNTGTGAQTELLDANGRTQAWTTQPTKINATGNYRFVFVSGTNDASCGGASGASLYIDNVRVFGTKVNDAVASSVARLVTYTNTSDAPPASRSVTLKAVTADGGTASASKTVNITAVDDPPGLSTPTGPTFTNTSADDTFNPATGTLSATDPDGDAITYGISGGTADPTTVNAIAYAVSSTGTFGTLRVATNGAWRFEPDDAALDPHAVSTTETFTVTATASGVERTATFTVTISVPASAPTVPGTPSAAPSGAGAITVSSWSPPGWLGGSSISDHTVQYRVAGTAPWSTFNDGTTPGNSITVTGLTKNTPYEFRVAASNATGTSPYSATVAATTFDTPAAPTIDAITTTATTMEIAFTAPSSDGGMPVTGYAYSLNGGTSFSLVATTASPITVTGLDPGRTYDVQLRAVNAVGDGTATDGQTAAMVLPVPTGVTASATGVGIIGVDWTASAIANGPAIDHYVVGYSPVGTNAFVTFATTSAVTIDVTGLADASAYDIRVRAVNADGVQSEWTAPVEASTWSVPSSPTIAEILTTETQLTITYTPPASDGGTAVTGLEYSLDGGATWTATVGLATTFVVAPLAPGAVYDVTVRALNAVGNGVAAGATTAAMVLPAPTPVSAAPDGAGSIGLAWNAPAAPGGPGMVAYDIDRRTAGSADAWVPAATFAATSGSITGLDPGTAYEFRIRARNAVAVVSLDSATIAATTHALPDAPTISSAVPGIGTITIAVTAPAADGGMPLTHYEYSTDLGGNWTTPASPLLPSPHTITRLIPGAVYDVWLRAVTEVGPGATTSATVRTLLPPPPPPETGDTDDTDPDDTTAPDDTTDTDGDGIPDSDDPSDGDTSPTSPMPSAGDVVTVAPGEEPSLVDTGDADAVSVPPGDAQVIVDGQPVVTDVQRIDTDLAGTPPERRTAAQVAELQRQANAMWTAYVERLADDVVPTVRMEATATGAVIHGLVFDPVTGESVGVPVEHVVMVVSENTALVLTVAANAATTGPTAEGVLTVEPDGAVNVVATGLQPDTAGEVVIFSSPRLVARFATDATGAFRGEFSLPDDVEGGRHSLVFAAPSATASLGIEVVPAPGKDGPAAPSGRLPSTGSDQSGAALAVFMICAGLLMVFGSRRWAHR